MLWLLGLWYRSLLWRRLWWGSGQLQFGGLLRKELGQWGLLRCCRLAWFLYKGGMRLLLRLGWWLLWGQGGALLGWEGGRG